MKIFGKYLLFIFFLFGLAVNASDSEVSKLPADQAFFKKAAKTLNLSHRKVENLQGINTGYYLIAGVFGSPENARRFAKKMSYKGFAAELMLNPENQMHYVSLGFQGNGLDLLENYQKKIKPNYTDKVWILQVENNT
ncbi:MAG: SPOR domain-containing protein, partial [Eudoraea sp.]|nr:SPOR domain-containing protein [Eudoraea sp.]